MINNDQYKAYPVRESPYPSIIMTDFIELVEFLNSENYQKGPLFGNIMISSLNRFESLSSSSVLELNDEVDFLRNTSKSS